MPFAYLFLLTFEWSQFEGKNINGKQISRQLYGQVFLEITHMRFHARSPYWFMQAKNKNYTNVFYMINYVKTVLL